MILSIFFILLIIFGVGLPIVLLLAPRQHPAATLGISYLIGIGIFTFIMFLTNIAGIRFSLLNELILLFLISIPLVLLKRKEIGEFFTDIVRASKKLHLSPVEKIMLGALAYVIISSFVNTLYWPVYLWDSLNLYDFRAHIFVVTGFMKYGLTDSYYIGYPLLTSLAQTLVFLSGGQSSQFLHSLFYLALGAGFYGLLRKFVSRKISLLFTLILLISGPLFYHSLISYTNLAYTVYLSLGAIYVYLWDKKRRTGYLVLSAFLTSLSTWTRSVEPFWLGILLVVFIVAIYRRKIWDIVIFSLFFFPIREAWKVFQSWLTGAGGSTVGEVVGYTKTLPTLFDATRWVQIAGYLYKYVVVPWDTIFVAFILAIVSLFMIKKQKKLFLIFFITFALLGVLVVGTFAFSIGYAGTFAIGDAAQRLSMLFYPLFAFCIALVMQELVRLKK
jgi:hypothetical protein